MTAEKEGTSTVTVAKTTRTASDEKTLRPILVDLGSRSKKSIKELKRGEGHLLTEVAEAIDDVRHKLGPEYKGHLLPVLVIYRQKTKVEASNFPFISPFSLLGK